MRLILFVIFLVFAVYSLSVLNILFNDRTSSITEPFVLEIKEGDSVTSVKGALAQARLLAARREWIFDLWGRVKGYDRKLKVGRAEIPYGASIDTLWDRIINTSKSVIELRFIEGWALRDIKKYLEEQDIEGAENFDEYAKGLEGYLFPDTYEFFSDVNTQEIIERMRGTLDKKIPEQWLKEIRSQEKTLHTILTMASILESEVRSTQDRKLVSHILWRRLNAGWPLQVDSTVNYITGKKKPSITFEEAQIDSPYNTYKYRGLPPGPIGNPGIDAIEAAIYPEKNNYWFFLTTPDGEVKYAVDLEGHNANRRFLR